MSEAIKFTQTATVAKVIDEYTVIINKGSTDGVRDGARFLIYGLGDEILDPETNESLGNLELVRGIGSAIHVQEKMATIKSAKTKSPTPTIKTVKRSPRGMGHSLIGVLGDETIEERQGEPTIVPFDGARTGDRAKPL
jgi:hypothetical protein